jgi:hypothetical protein
MSKISYSSIDEVWGVDFSSLKDNKKEINYKDTFSKSNDIINLKEQSIHTSKQPTNVRENVLNAQNATTGQYFGLNDPELGGERLSLADDPKLINHSRYEYDFDKRKKIYVSDTQLNNTKVADQYNFDNLYANDNHNYFKTVPDFKTRPVTSGCTDYNQYFEHILDCKGCQDKFRKFFMLTHTPPPSKQITETFSNIDYGNNKNSNPIYTDIICLILIGIFLIFILDFFVNFGKKWFHKK